jgi:hypothetical protein
VWERAAKHYDEEQLGALVATIAIINAFNRGNVILQNPAGDYRPGMFGLGTHNPKRRPRGVGPPPLCHGSGATA